MSKPRPTSKPPRIGRKRRAAGWTLLLLGLLVAGAWVASGWWMFTFDSSDGSRISFIAGEIQIITDGAMAPDFFDEGNGERVSIQPRHEGWVFWFGWNNQVGTSTWKRGGLSDTFSRGVFRLTRDMFTHRLIVIWPIPLLLWTPAALLLRSGYLARRRANTGQCAKCGYSLAGLASDAPCPECGKGAGTK